MGCGMCFEGRRYLLGSSKMGWKNCQFNSIYGCQWFPHGFDGDFMEWDDQWDLPWFAEDFLFSHCEIHTTWEIYIGYIEYILRFCRSLSKFRLWLLNGDRMIPMGYVMLCSTIIKHVFFGIMTRFLMVAMVKTRPFFREKCLTQLASSGKTGGHAALCPRPPGFHGDLGGGTATYGTSAEGPGERSRGGGRGFGGLGGFFS